MNGMFFTYMAIDRASKLIINRHTAKRNGYETEQFLIDLRSRVQSHFQLSTDGYRPYCGHSGLVRAVFGESVDYGTEIKNYTKRNTPIAIRIMKNVYTSKELVSVTKKRIIGNPDMDTVTTCHAERTNLSVRLFTRRFTRCTLRYSKTLENLKYAVALSQWLLIPDVEPFLDGDCFELWHGLSTTIQLIGKISLILGVKRQTRKISFCLFMAVLNKCCMKTCQFQ